MLALIESGRELSGQVTLEALLQRILARAGQLTDSPDTSVILSHDGRDGLYVAAATGDKAEWVLTTFGKHSLKSIPVEGSKAGTAYSTGRSILENKVRGHFEAVDHETKKVTESMVCVPLRAGEEAIGAMQILNKRSGEYTEHDRILLEHFASQAAIAIKNAQLFESLLAHSGLYIRLDPAMRPAELMRELHRPAHTEELTVLFADMRGFTQLCNSMRSPARVQDHLNEYISMLAEEVIVHDGMVNKFLGDGVMALFRHDNHAERAVKTAFRIVDRFSEIKAGWNDRSSEDLSFLDVGIGIVTDEVTIGAIGSETVRDFTAIGAAVNLAAAFELVARDGKRIIVNHLTYRLVKEQVEAESLEDYVLKKPGQTVGIRHNRYFLKRLAEPSDQSVFVSHSHDDRDFVESRLVLPLKELGIRTWYASNDIPKGSIWTAEIRKALSECTWMLIVVSKNSSGSEWVRLEVDLAVGLGHMLGKMIPIQLDETSPARVNEYLVSMQAIDGRTTAELAATIAALLGAPPGVRRVSPALDQGIKSSRTPRPE
ncbi:MAG: TIR domain-containing protein [Deltaproteobacteria bacterium]|nr:TIR domain-containing protein [Deltaproteobacteria bacterium]